MIVAPANTPEILWLGDRACHDPARVGGKAAHLSRLAAEHRVPPGFCLTASAFDPRHPADGPLPPSLSAALAAAYEALTLGGDIPVAVRSSALDEDGELASFAGQHDTELNLIGIEAVLGAVVRCWASGRNERALAYRERHGLAAEEARVAVLVQQLVMADVSAVVFSANPVTKNLDEVVVTSTWGLGESLVGGTATPDTWVVRKGDLEVLEEQTGAKERMTVVVNGGTREVVVPRLLREKATLSEDQVMELAELAVGLEKRFGRPVDVEAAYADEQIFLLQCRPITTLAEVGTTTAADGLAAVSI